MFSPSKMKTIADREKLLLNESFSIIRSISVPIFRKIHIGMYELLPMECHFLQIFIFGCCSDENERKKIMAVRTNLFS